MARQRKSEAVRQLEKLRGRPLTFGSLLRSVRESDGHTLEALAKRLEVSRSHLCDVEKCRRRVSVERAARWAKLLGYPAQVFVQLALQDEVDAAGLKLRVDVEAA